MLCNATLQYNTIQYNSIQYNTIQYNNLLYMSNNCYTIAALRHSSSSSSTSVCSIVRTVWSAPFPTTQISSCRTAYRRARACSSPPLRTPYEAYSCTSARYPKRILHFCCPLLPSTATPSIALSLAPIFLSLTLSLIFFVYLLPPSLPPSSLPLDPCRAHTRGGDPNWTALDIQCEDEVHPAARGHRGCRFLH
jgi:hypothetical protein